MIACDGPDCPIEWFHFSCVGITEEPETDEEWFCDQCKERLICTTIQIIIFIIDHLHTKLLVAVQQI